ncbi:MAG: hypothetical protein AB7F25_12465 [Deferribacterales bacterium]
MNAELTKALKELFQNTLNDCFEEDNKGEYKPLSFYEYALPRRDAAGEKLPFIVFFPLDGEDDDSSEKEVTHIAISCCIHLAMDKTGSFEQLSEGNLAVMLLLNRVKKVLRENRIVGNMFRRTGKMKWKLFDNNTQPSPFFYAVIEASFESYIERKPTKAEDNAYGKKFGKDFVLK